jgi:hypothetical protein
LSHGNPWFSEQSDQPFVVNGFHQALMSTENTSYSALLARSFELEERTNEKTEGFTQEEESQPQT